MIDVQTSVILAIVLTMTVLFVAYVFWSILNMD